MRRALIGFALGVSAMTAQAVQIESDADIHKRFQGDDELIVAVVGTIVSNGYQCNSLSTLYPFIRGSGFRVGCNHWTKFYELEDQGNNRWVVKRK